jgi:hypothetical protein
MPKLQSTPALKELCSAGDAVIEANWSCQTSLAKLSRSLDCLEQMSFALDDTPANAELNALIDAQRLQIGSVAAQLDDGTTDFFDSLSEIFKQRGSS